MLIYFNSAEYFLTLNDSYCYALNFIQAVYNANKFAKLSKRRDRLQNWLDYYQLKFERHPDKRSTVKVFLLSAPRYVIVRNVTNNLFGT